MSGQEIRELNKDERSDALILARKALFEDTEENEKILSFLQDYTEEHRILGAYVKDVLRGAVFYEEEDLRIVLLAADQSYRNRKQTAAGLLDAMKQKAELENIGEELEDELTAGNAVFDRIARIGVQEYVLQKAQELLRGREIQVQLFAERVDRVLRGVFAEHHDRGIARHQPDDEKDRDRHEDNDQRASQKRLTEPSAESPFFLRRFGVFHVLIP